VSVITLAAICLISASPAADVAEKPTALSPVQLRGAVHDALRKQATAKGPDRIVAVRKLVALHQQLGLNQQMAPGARRQLQGMIGGRLRRAQTNDDYGQDLLELIEKTIAPGTWDSQGGPGRIFYWRNGRAMVISQTQEAHEELADLIGQLHAAGN
jgi:hypothetical protein